VTFHCVEISVRELGDFSPSLVTSVQPWREASRPQFCCVLSCFGQVPRRSFVSVLVFSFV
jgi:hypothetical protein